MLWLVSQIPDAPKTLDLSAWFPWVVGLLVIVIGYALVHLRSSAAEARAAADKQSDKMEGLFREMIEKLDERHDQEVEERHKDRAAEIEGSKQITEALVEVKNTQIAMTHEIVGLRSDLVRSGLKPKGPPP